MKIIVFSQPGSLEAGVSRSPEDIRFSAGNNEFDAQVILTKVVSENRVDSPSRAVRFLAVSHASRRKIRLGNGKTAEADWGLVIIYLSGTYMLEREAPIPGVPCTTFWLVIANSPV